MITAVDTNVLLDVLLPDPVFGPPSLAALERAAGEGRLSVCEAVYAETASRFASTADLSDFFRAARIELMPSSPEALGLAGRLWREWNGAREGAANRRYLADFLVAAHAMTHCGRLLTRDRGFCRSMFSGLSVLDPSCC